MRNYENKEIPHYATLRSELRPKGRISSKKGGVFIEKGKNYFFSTVSFILSRLEITTVSPL